MTTLQIVALAVIQGLAEMLPISSSAHVILAERFMGLDPAAPEMTFLLVMLHTGSMFGVLFYFRHRWKSLLLPSAGESTGDRLGFLKMLVVATICTGVLGYALKIGIEKVLFEGILHHDKGEVEQLFRYLPLMGASLLAVGIFIIVAGMRASPTQNEPLTLKTSVWIGVVQGLCLPFRGFSRSGATISTALCRGVGQRLAEEFSFALAVILTPPVIFLELRRLLKARESLEGTSLKELLMPGVLGMVCSFVAAMLALWLLSAVLERGKWKYFGYYCVVAAAVVFAVHARL
jgi:undecaprenyl-diphosphatase